MSEAAGERIAKWLARAGVASRRDAERLIAEGKVKLNGALISHPATFVTPGDVVLVDGRPIAAPERTRLWRYHKPDGLMTTHRDPEGRPTVFEKLPPELPRVVSVGRLDLASEGLLLLTNDGEFAHRITSASTHVPKTYLVKVNGLLTGEQEEQFRAGVPLSGRRTAPAGLRLARRAQNPWYEVRLIEGRHHQVREMFRHFGKLVEKLRRVKIGFLELGALRPGHYRQLTPSEVERFRKLLKLV